MFIQVSGMDVFLMSVLCTDVRTKCLFDVCTSVRSWYVMYVNMSGLDIWCLCRFQVWTSFLCLYRCQVWMSLWCLYRCQISVFVWCLCKCHIWMSCLQSGWRMYSTTGVRSECLLGVCTGVRSGRRFGVCAGDRSGQELWKLCELTPALCFCRWQLGLGA